MSIQTHQRTDHPYAPALPLGVTKRSAPAHAKASERLVWPWIAAGVLLALSVLAFLPLILN
jgi:hypothetical protein